MCWCRKVSGSWSQIVAMCRRVEAGCDRKGRFVSPKLVFHRGREGGEGKTLYFFFPLASFPRLSALRLTILVIRSNGIGSSSGNRSELLAPR